MPTLRRSHLQVADHPSSVGPRKLSTVLALALGRWRDFKDKNDSTDQLTSPTSALSPLSSPGPYEEETNTTSGALQNGTSSPEHENSRPALSNGTLVLPVRGVENTDGNGVVAATNHFATATPMSRKSLSQTSVSVVDPSDFLLVDDNAINLKVSSSPRSPCKPSSRC